MTNRAHTSFRRVAVAATTLLLVTIIGWNALYHWGGDDEFLPYSVPPAPGSTSKSLILDSLMRANTPEASLAAAMVLNECSTARRLAAERTLVINPRLRRTYPTQEQAQEVCGDLAPSQLGMEIALLARAAEAGVRGAWDRLTIALIDRPDDQDLRSEHKRITALLLRKANPGVLLAMAETAATCLNPPACTRRDLDRGLTYWYASRMASQIQGADPRGEMMAKELGPVRVEAALVAARQLISDSRAH